VRCDTLASYQTSMKAMRAWQLLPTIEVPWLGRQEVQGEAGFTQFREAHYAD
jgi:hypothetical protein